MTDSAPTDDQALFRVTARSFLENEASLRTVRSWIDRPDGFDAGWWRQAAEIGFTSFLVPEAAGGGSLSGRGLDDLLIVADEMGRLVSPGPLVPANVVAAALAEQGTPDQQEQLLPGILAGDIVPGWSERAEVQVVAGDDGYRAARHGQPGRGRRPGAGRPRDGGRSRRVSPSSSCPSTTTASP